MTTAVIGATGRVGSEIVRGLLARGDPVAALARDPDKARRAFGEPDGLHIRPTRLDDPRDLGEAFDGIRTVFIAMGSLGIEGVLQRIAINTAARISSIEQVTRLSVLNASADSLGINQRAHDSIDQFAASTAAPGGRVPSRVPRGIRLMPGVTLTTQGSNPSLALLRFGCLPTDLLRLLADSATSLISRGAHAPTPGRTGADLWSTRPPASGSRVLSRPGCDSGRRTICGWHRLGEAVALLAGQAGTTSSTFRCLGLAERGRRSR
jgi:NAD(P)-dependent dehydrogenase (short-subunit alcohol dehydrogenase family)